MSDPWSSGRLLAVDSASPLLSVAVGSSDGILAQRSVPAERSSSTLMRLLDECLEAAGTPVRELSGAVALRGPGAFTGLRVGLALVMGLRQALGLPVATLPTCEALAATACPAERPILVAVVAGRRHWIVQRYGPGDVRRAESDATRLPVEELSRHAGPLPVVGFGIAELAEGLRPRTPVTPPPLAPLVLGAAERATWDAESLSKPLYPAPPPARLPGATPG